MDLRDAIALTYIVVMGINGFLIVFRELEITDMLFGKDPSKTKRIYGSGFWLLLTGALLWASWGSLFK